VGQQIACDATVPGDTRNMQNRFSSYACMAPRLENGTERIYYLSTDSPATIQAFVTTYDHTVAGNPDVFLLSDLDSNMCVPGGFGDGSSPSSIATYSNAPAGITYIVVDGWQGWSGQFTLQVQCSAPSKQTTIYLPVILGDFYQ
jgi:hypothetical protein